MQPNPQVKLLKKSPAHYETWSFITLLTSAHHLPLISAKQIQLMVSNQFFFGRSILILPFQPCVTFPKTLNLHNQEATSLFPTSKMEDYSFSLSRAVYSTNSQVTTIFATVSSIHNPRMHHAMIRGTLLTWTESYEVSTKVFIHMWLTHNIPATSTNCKNNIYWMLENFEDIYCCYGS